MPSVDWTMYYNHCYTTCISLHCSFRWGFLAQLQRIAVSNLSSRVLWQPIVSIFPNLLISSYSSNNCEWRIAEMLVNTSHKTSTTQFSYCYFCVQTNHTNYVVRIDFKIFSIDVTNSSEQYPTLQILFECHLELYTPILTVCFRGQLTCERHL